MKSLLLELNHLGPKSEQWEIDRCLALTADYLQLSLISLEMYNITVRHIRDIVKGEAK